MVWVEEQAVRTVLARKNAGWCSHARQRESRKALWKREKLELGLYVSSRLEISEKSQRALQ